MHVTSPGISRRCLEPNYDSYYYETGRGVVHTFSTFQIQAFIPREQKPEDTLQERGDVSEANHSSSVVVDTYTFSKPVRCPHGGRCRCTT